MQRRWIFGFLKMKLNHNYIPSKNNSTGLISTGIAVMALVSIILSFV